MKLLVVKSVCRRMFYISLFAIFHVKTISGTSDTNCYSCLLNSSSAFVEVVYLCIVMEALNLHVYECHVIFLLVF